MQRLGGKLAFLQGSERPGLLALVRVITGGVRQRKEPGVDVDLGQLASVVMIKGPCDEVLQDSGQVIPDLETCP